MNLSALPELLLSWVRNQGAALLQGDKPSAPTFQSGQQYEGKVVDNLTSGRHLVRVGNQMLDMNLPARTQPGDTVRLTYVNAGPRPTFLLNQAPVSAVQQVQISNTAQQVNALLRLAQTPAASAPATATATVAAPAANTAANAATNAAAAPSQPLAARTATTMLEMTRSLGAATPAAASPSASPAAARPIVANVVMLQNYSAALQPTTTTLTGPNTGLLGQAVDAARASVPSSTTLSANTLVDLPAAARHMLPVRLSQTLAESGMFYESHLAKWSKGTLSLEAVLREPQARLGQEAHLSSKLAELGGMPEEAARMAGRQLQMLEGAPFLWQGLAWPGQTMQWLIREESGGEGQGEAGDGAAEWVTELNLTLPRMGEVHAQLGLSGDRLRLRLHASDPATRDALAAALPLLARGFETSGLHAVDMQVAELSSQVSHGEG